MKREEIEKAARRYLIGLTYKEAADFAIQQVNAAREEDARLAVQSKFEDGPQGTIEGQIARAIRALKIEGKP